MNQNEKNLLNSKFGKLKQGFKIIDPTFARCDHFWRIVTMTANGTTVYSLYMCEYCECKDWLIE